MITELTQDQIDQIPHFAEKWLKIVTSTDRTNRPKAEEAVRRIYKILKLEKPKIIWCDNPKEAYYRAGSVGLPGDELDRIICETIFPVGLYKQIHGEPYIDIDTYIEIACEESFTIIRHLNFIFMDEGYHKWWTPRIPMNWVIFYDYYVNCLGLEDTPGLLKPLKHVCESCPGFSISLLKNICVLCERPTIFSINDKGQLHNEDGPALAFNDGFEIHAINGEIQNT